jgi:hypothetical chaperone protein
MRIGLDFGTTNSGAAVFDGRRVHVFPLDPTGHDPTVVRSTVYLTRDHQVFVGREALDAYYRQNVGRPSRMVRQYVGEIEMTFAELPTFVREVYVLVDKLTPGRLLHSLKSELAGGYRGTTLFGRHYELEELIALYLRELRRRVEAQTGGSVDGVVLGRPVHFAGGGEAGDRRAERRLRRAAEMAGFQDVAFELEPVAAALHYELTVAGPQNVVVFDFGGGTLDVTVMRVGEPGQRRVFATGGVDIAGDAFDRRIIEGLMLEHFGRGTTWGRDEAPFPRQYTDALAHWQTIPELNRPETLHFLRLAQATGSHPSRVRALESLLINNHAMRLIDQVERAKVTLSTTRFALVRLAGEDATDPLSLDVWQPVTRSQFEALIAEARRRIEACLLDTLERSGLEAGQIDAAVRTGGSAQIPCFVEMMGRVFGSDKVVLSDVFSGVTSGLAIRARDEQAGFVVGASAP